MIYNIIKRTCLKTYGKRFRGYYGLRPPSDLMIRWFIIIVAFLENATIEYSSESLCVCVHVCVFVCVCVCFSTITQKEIDLGR